MTQYSKATTAPKTTKPSTPAPPASGSLGPFTISTAGGPKAWPDVCTFTNTAQLRALDHQITGLKGQPVGTKSALTSGGNTPRNTDCKYNLTTSFDTADTADNPSWVTISLVSVNQYSASSFQQDAKSGVKKYPHLPGGANCFYDGGLLECLKGDIVYYVNGVKSTGSNNFNADQAKWLTEILLPLATRVGAELSSKP